MSLSFTNVDVRAPLFQTLNGLFRLRANYEFLQRTLFSVAPACDSPSHLTYHLTGIGGGCFLNVALSCSGLPDHHEMFHPKLGELLRMTLLSTECWILLVIINSQNMG